MYVRTYVCMYVCMYVCSTVTHAGHASVFWPDTTAGNVLRWRTIYTYTWICVVMRARDECSKLSAPRVYIIWYVCMYVCIYMCMFVLVYLYTCKHMSLCVHTCECVCTCWQYMHAYTCEFMRRIDTICMFRTCDPVMRIRVWVSSCTWQLCECFDYFVFLQVYLIRRLENWNIPVGVRI